MYLHCHFITTSFEICTYELAWSYEIAYSLHWILVRPMYFCFLTNKFLCNLYIHGIALEWAKSPRMLPPSPPRNLRFFGDFPPKNPRNFGYPRPRSVPETVGKRVPVLIPEFRGFSGTGMIFPRRFKLSPSPNFPQTSFKGYPRGSPGIPEI